MRVAIDEGTPKSKLKIYSEEGPKGSVDALHTRQPMRQTWIAVLMGDAEAQQQTIQPPESCRCQDLYRIHLWKLVIIAVRSLVCRKKGTNTFNMAQR